MQTPESVLNSVLSHEQQKVSNYFQCYAKNLINALILAVKGDLNASASQIALAQLNAKWIDELQLFKLAFELGKQAGESEQLYKNEWDRLNKAYQLPTQNIQDLIDELGDNRFKRKEA